MKKKILAICLFGICVLTACGQKDLEKTEGAELYEYVVSSEFSKGQEGLTQEESFYFAGEFETGESSDTAERAESKEVFHAAEESETEEAFRIAEESETEEVFRIAEESESEEVFRTADKPESEESFHAAEGAESQKPSDSACTPEQKENLYPVQEPEPILSSEPEIRKDTPVHTSCIWDGGTVTVQPTCSTIGLRTYTCTVCGSLKTENIQAASHQYVTENMEATCTEAGGVRTCCSVCGYVQTEKRDGVAAGHDYQKEYWPAPPTCLSGADYIIKCTKCGDSPDVNYVSEGALPHTPVATEVLHGDCMTPSIIAYVCSGCGFEVSREGHFEEEHDWLHSTCEELNPETLEYETITVIYCSRCGKHQ